MAAPSTMSDLYAYNFNLEICNFMSQLKDPMLALGVGKSFLHELAREGDTLSAELVISAGASVNQPDEEGRRPLHEAAAAGQLEMVDLLLKNGALIDAPIHPFGHTALWLAVQAGKKEVVQYLLEKGARISVADSLSGQGLLHQAALYGDMIMAGVLIAAGIDVLHQDKRGQTARDLAIRNGHRSLEAVLKKVMEHHARYYA
jgi:ankyrin repeat protein